MSNVTQFENMKDAIGRDEIEQLGPEIDESHEALSDQILMLIFLLVISNSVSSIIHKFKFKALYSGAVKKGNQKSKDQLTLINEQAVSLILGICTGLIVIYSPIYKTKAKIIEK